MALENSAELDPRFVDLRQIFNFRDLGGLETRDGRTVRTGLVYRSDQLGFATDEDIDVLVNKIGLKTVVDLRRPTEITGTGGFSSAHGVDVVNLELRHISWDLFTERSVEDEPSPVRFLVERYTGMIETGADAIRGTLNLMCDASPLVFHCMAGKDRTGIIAGIALSLLGVSTDDIADDYAMTRDGMARYRTWLTESGTELSQWGLEPRAEAMHGLLDRINQAFGSVEGYANAIGFERTQALKERLLDS